MIGSSHAIITVAVASCAASFIFPSLPVFVPHGGYNQPVIQFSLFLTGFLLGAKAPDWLEFPYYEKAPGYGTPSTRKTVIPHRTWTHWLPLWVAFPLLVYTKIIPPHILSYAAVGFFLSGTLHLVLDAFTKGGIPFLYPFGCIKKSRYDKKGSCLSLGLMMTGGAGEKIFTTLAAGLLFWETFNNVEKIIT